MRSSSITSNMKKALRASLLGEASSVATPTANALARSGLWDSARKLTRDGWLLALENAPLKLQAQKLGLSILEVPKPSSFLRPEIVAYKHFEKKVTPEVGAKVGQFCCSFVPLLWTICTK